MSGLESLTRLIKELTQILQTTKEVQAETEGLVAQVLQGGPVTTGSFADSSPEELEYARQCLEQRSRAQAVKTLHEDALEFSEQAVETLASIKTATAAVTGQRESSAEMVRMLYKKRMDSIALEHESILSVNHALRAQLKYRYDVLRRMQYGLERVDRGFSTPLPSKSSPTAPSVTHSTPENS